MAINLPALVAVLLSAGMAVSAAAEDGVTDNAILIGQTVGVSGQIAGAVKELNEASPSIHCRR